MTPDPVTAAVSPPPSASWVSVAELLQRQVPMHWSEAVAITAELCAVLLGRNLRVIPHAADVLISGDGKLAIRTEDDDESSPTALGRMLHSLCATASPPAPLRLFISVATSSDRYESVAAFAEALAAYEGPEREKLIQAAHDRWVAARNQSATSAEIPMRPAPELEDEKKPDPKARARRLPRWAIAAAVVAIVMGGGASAWMASGKQVPSLPPISLTSISSSVESAIQQASAWIGGSAPAQVAAAEPEAAPKPARATRRRRSTAVASVTTPDPGAGAASTEATPGSDAVASAGATTAPDGVTIIPVVVNDTSAVEGDDASAGAGAGETSDVVADADPTVYSRAFAGVMPPVMTTRQIASPGVLSPGVEAISTIEVVVDEAGEVENVKLLSRPSPVLATMLLSAAKTWKFRPALHDGRPVKYRLRLDVATTRP